jgi:protease IV
MSDKEQNQQPTNKWERELLQRLAFANLNEQRRARKWGVFFKLLIFIYLFALLFIANPDLTKIFSTDSELFSETKGHTALVDLTGVISSDMQASADSVVRGLRRAFRDSNTKGVILRINSPGGSPVQAGYISDEIMRLRGEYPDIPFYVVIADICASGGYYIAATGQEIYANKASLVGSIGVIMSGGFGFVETLEKLGIERRVYAAGENKAFLDPFSPEKPQDVEHIKMLLSNIHQQFIDVVKEGRGEKLNGEQEQLFSGLIWTGEQALALGLIDGFGSAAHVAREVIGTEKILDFTHKPDYFERLAEQFGASMSSYLFKPFHEGVTLR